MKKDMLAECKYLEVSFWIYLFENFASTFENKEWTDKYTNWEKNNNQK